MDSADLAIVQPIEPQLAVLESPDQVARQTIDATVFHRAYEPSSIRPKVPVLRQYTSASLFEKLAA
jgi:hypothetical protein